MSIGSFLGRAALAVGTGGLSELGGARTIADAYHSAGGPDYMHQAADALGLSKPAALGTVQGEINENDQRRQDFANQLANYQNRAAPQQQAVQLAPQQRAEMPQAPQQQRAAGTASQIAAQAGASPVANTTLGPMATMQAANMGPAATAEAGQASAGQVDTGGAVRNQMAGANDMLRNAAQGNAPSVAEEQLKRGTAANIAGQYAMAKTQHGYGGVAALNNAQNNADQMNTELGSRQADLRAGEMANARNAYVGALQGTRAQDLGAQQFNVGLGADISKFNAGQNTATSQFNAGQTNDIATQRARFAQEAAANNMAAQNQGTLAQGQINANAASQNSAQGTDVSKFNAGAANNMGQFNETNRQNNEQFNASQGNDMGKFLAGLQANNSQFNAGQGNNMAIQQGNLNYQVGANNQKSGLDVMQMDDAQKRALMNFLQGSQDASINGSLGLVGGQQAANNSRLNFVKDLANVGKGLATGGALGGGGGGAAGAYDSDAALPLGYAG